MRTTAFGLLLSIALLIPVDRGHAQSNWTKSPSSPFIAPGIEPSVIYDTTQKMFKLWYVSLPTLSVNYAVSFNGTTWLSYPYGSVLAPGPAGSIDEGGIWGVNVIQAGPVYYMYYTALGVVNGGADTLRICEATSANGFDWQKYSGNPVLSTGPKRTWESGGLAGEHLLYEGGSFTLFYTAIDSAGHGRIGLAASADGYHWAKFENNPVLSGDSAGWDAGNVFPGGLVKKDSVYYMLYCGNPLPGTSSGTQVGLATSRDLKAWGKPYKHPVISPGAAGQWDQYGAAEGTLLYLNGKFNYWYNGYGPGGWSIGYATSTPGPLSVQEVAPGMPEEASLEQNYPNPFNPATHIEFVMPAAGRATLKVFDLRGAEVATIVDATLPAGRHAYQWNAQRVSSGVYFYRLQADGLSESRKMIVVK
jgi:hypothetical protein